MHLLGQCQVIPSQLGLVRFWLFSSLFSIFLKLELVSMIDPSWSQNLIEFQISNRVVA
jgi:hypothetical protein